MWPSTAPSEVCGAGLLPPHPHKCLCWLCRAMRRPAVTSSTAGRLPPQRPGGGPEGRNLTHGRGRTQQPHPAATQGSPARTAQNGFHGPGHRKRCARTHLCLLSAASPGAPPGAPLQDASLRLACQGGRRGRKKQGPLGMSPPPQQLRVVFQAIRDQLQADLHICTAHRSQGRLC